MQRAGPLWDWEDSSGQAKPDDARHPLPLQPAQSAPDGVGFDQASHVSDVREGHLPVSKLWQEEGCSVAPRNSFKLCRAGDRRLLIALLSRNGGRL